MSTVTLLHFFPLSFFHACENVWPGLWVRKATWAFAILETMHIMVLAVLLGTTFVLDLRLLGLGLKRRPTGQLANELRPWNLTALALMVLTGVPLFMSEAVRMAQNVPFFYKMVLLFLAIVTQFTIFRAATQPGKPDGAAMGKLAACLSLTLWFGVALAGRAIAFLG
jgi:hypothetical protein